MSTDKNDTRAKTRHGTTLSTITDKNMYNSQFRLKKSDDVTLQILRNFTIMIVRYQICS
ncbi:MAG: hypothetical protein FWC33_06835 [Candidatus Bathyarchaeota archaeon]|nr:hypothetical protein [Candidatus Termiticorpusculum sp.]